MKTVTWKDIAGYLATYHDKKGFTNLDSLGDGMLLDEHAPSEFLMTKDEWERALILYGNVPARSRSEWWKAYCKLGYLELKKNKTDEGYFMIDVIRVDLGTKYVESTNKRAKKEEKSGNVQVCDEISEADAAEV